MKIYKMIQILSKIPFESSYIRLLVISAIATEFTEKKGLEILHELYPQISFSELKTEYLNRYHNYTIDDLEKDIAYLYKKANQQETKLKEVHNETF